MRILLISYHFPPIGGAGTQRPVALARLLTASGRNVEVVTASGSGVGRWTPRDESLYVGLPTETLVHRLTGTEPSPDLSVWPQRLRRWLSLRSAWSRWWAGSLSDNLRTHCQGAQLVYVIASPYDSIAVVGTAAGDLGLPWVADLGDPWALDEMLVFPTWVHRRLEMRRMRRALGSAAAIVMNTPEAARRLREAFPEFAEKLVVAIPNGFDANDFSAPLPPRENGRFRIVHTGYLHTELGLQQRRGRFVRRILGGAVPGVDIYTRSHVFLLEAVARLVERDPGLASRIEVVFAGVVSDTDRRIAEAYPQARVLGYLPHAESVALTRNADLLFLPMHNLPPGKRSTIVPGKTYEYLASGTPILAAVPEGDARDLLEAAGNAYICAPDDTDALANGIHSAMAGSALERRLGRRDSAVIDEFEWNVIAEKVADVIDYALAERRIPVRSSWPVHAVQTATPRLHGAAEPRRAVLFLAYYFPPIGGAGVQRALKFARYLPECGFDPIVVTGSGLGSGRFTPRDASLEAELPPESRIRRISTPEPSGRGRWSQRLERWLRWRSGWSSWWVDGAVEVARETATADVILTSMSPYETAFAAARLSGILRVPWVANLRDPWALDEMLVFPTWAHRRLEMRRMRRALGSAAAIVMNTPEAARRLREAFPEFAEKLVVAIPNGFDANDFSAAVSPREDDRFRIVHTGYLHTELGLQQRRSRFVRRILGGAARGVDIYTRSHVFLLEAVARLVERDPGLASRIEVVFAGVVSETDRRVAEAYPQARVLGYLPHAESVELTRTADLLFLPMHNLPPGKRSTIVPGKTYEYLASGTPILAAVPEGDARDLLEAAGNAFVCAPDDIDALADGIRRAFDRREATVAPGAPSPELVNRFERRALTAELAHVLSEVITRRSVEPGSQVRRATMAATGSPGGAKL